MPCRQPQQGLHAPLLDAECRRIARQLCHHPAVARQSGDSRDLALDVLCRALVGFLNEHPASHTPLASLRKNFEMGTHDVQNCSRQCSSEPFPDPEVLMLSLAAGLISRHTARSTECGMSVHWSAIPQRRSPANADDSACYQQDASLASPVQQSENVENSSVIRHPCMSPALGIGTTLHSPRTHRAAALIDATASNFELHQLTPARPAACSARPICGLMYGVLRHTCRGGLRSQVTLVETLRRLPAVQCRSSSKLEPAAPGTVKGYDQHLFIEPSGHMHEHWPSSVEKTPAVMQAFGALAKLKEQITGDGPMCM